MTLDARSPSPNTAPAHSIPRSMSRHKRVVLGVAGVVVLMFAGGFVFVVAAVAPLGTRYVSKRICSGVFVSEREPGSVWQAELHGGSFGYPPRFSWSIDRQNQSVTSRWNGLAAQTVQYRPGLGCTPNAEDEGISLTALTENELAPYEDPWPWPEVGSGEGKLAEAVNAAFSDPESGTRAVVVVQDGNLVAERYAPGFDRNSPMLGWSMNKSVLHALLGTQVLAGNLELAQDGLFEEWEGTDRAAITLEQMLQMQSGLAWAEDYANPFEDAIQMLFGSDSAAARGLQKPLTHAPGTHWRYSSGTSNMLALLLRRTLEHHGEEALGYPQRALFAPLGMRTSVLEPDATGTFVASSFGFASPVDWARFGQLYLEDGVAAGKRILPSGWSTFACTAAEASEGRYGAHFWLRGSSGDPAGPSLLPDDACHAVGHEGQYITIVPSRGTVVVRLGLTTDPSTWDQEQFVKSILEATAT